HRRAERRGHRRPKGRCMGSLWSSSCRAPPKMHPLVASVHNSPQRPILIRIEATFTRMSLYSLNTGMKAMITGAAGLRTGLNAHSYGLSGGAVEHAYCCARYLVNLLLHASQIT